MRLIKVVFKEVRAGCEGQEGMARLPAMRWKQGPLQTLKGSARDYQPHENFEEEAAGGQRKPEESRGT